MTDRATFTLALTVHEPGRACDLLARACGLPKGRVKDCMAKGGAWWDRPGRAFPSEQ